MAELKTKVNDASVEAFLDGITHERRRAEAKQVCAMMAEVTGAPPKMWGEAIIGFGSYHYTYESGRSGGWFLVGFSPRKTSLTLYIMAGFGEYEALTARLGKHKTGKSCLYINKLADVDLAVLRELVDESVAHMKAKYATDCASRR